MPKPPAQQASMQLKLEELARQCHDLETRELEVERRTRALNLSDIRDARVTAAAPVVGSSHSRTREQTPLKPRRASSQVASQRSLAPTRAPHSGIKVTSTVTTKTVKPLPASPQDGTNQDVKAMVQDLVKSSLTQLEVISQETPTQLQSQSSTMDSESPQLVDTSEGEISASDQEGLDSGTAELDQLILSVEEQLDFDSSPTPSVTKAPSTMEVR